jgi:hypothetical protein
MTGNSAQKSLAVLFPEASLNVCYTTRRHNPDEHTHIDPEILKLYIILGVFSLVELTLEPHLRRLT